MQEQPSNRINTDRSKKKGCGFVFLILVVSVTACSLGFLGFTVYKNKQLSAKFENRTDSFSSENITFSEEITYFDLDAPPDNFIPGEPVSNPSPTEEIPSPPSPAEQPSSQEPVSYQCPDLSGVRLGVGDRAVIVFDNVNLRSSPKVPDDYASNIVKELRKGATMTITGGPECSHNGTWWEVKTDTGLIGWMREYVPDNRLLDISSNASTVPEEPTQPPSHPAPQIPACPGALSTRVQVGMTIRVTTNQTNPVPKLGIRPQPTLDTKKMFELKSGEQMQVLDGPECANDSYFWKISSSKGSGWVREGNTKFYFVDPVK